MAPDLSNLVNPIRAHLEAKSDTERFVGLKLLITVFEKHPEVREDKDQIANIWHSIPAKFLDRLLRTACNPQAKDARECLTIAVSVIHALSLLVGDAGKDEKFVGRIPRLVPALLHSSPEITESILQLLLSLSREPIGAGVLIQVEDLSPLTEAAPSNRLALDVLRYAWLSSMHGSDFSKEDAQKMDEALKALVVSFSGTDATTLLDFLGDFLYEADTHSLPQNIPLWVEKVVKYIHSLASNRPTPEARDAYTKAADSLLKTWPEDAARLLFSSKTGSKSSPEVLFTKLLLVDIRVSVPNLFEQPSSTSHDQDVPRVARTFDIVSQLIAYLVRLIDNDEDVLQSINFDHLMALRKDIGESLNVVRATLWEAVEKEEADKRHLETPLVLAAIRTLSLWYRENDDEQMREEPVGLDLVVYVLYGLSLEYTSNTVQNHVARIEEKNARSPKIDFRDPCLITLQALSDNDLESGPFSKGEGYSLLLQDLYLVGQAFLGRISSDTSRWSQLVPVLDRMKDRIVGKFDAYVDHHEMVSVNFSRELRAAQNPVPQDAEIREFEFAVLRLVCDVNQEVNENARSPYTVSLLKDQTTRLWEQAVIINEDTAKSNQLKASMVSLVRDLEELKNKC